MSEDKVIDITVRLATEDDKDLPAYDNTKLQAINTCPTWGILRYVHHKTFQTNSRAMALEAGGAMHEVFAAVRLWQLVYHTLSDLDYETKMLWFNHHGTRLFGEERFGAMIDQMGIEAEDERTRCLNFCLAALYTSGFYDDPGDRRRTLSNLEEAAILYIDRYDFDRMPVWVRDRDDYKSDVGIEVAFDVVLSFTYRSGRIRSYRFVGKFDGLHWRDGDLVIGENKTASRMDEAWRMSFLLSSQVTGYTLSASIWTGEQCRRGVVLGLQIPLPKSVGDGFAQEHVTREDFHLVRWFDWFLHTVDIAEMYQGDITKAPKYTHSCNRYFRPCSFIPFCDSADEDQLQMIDEMVIDEWSPLHETTGGD